MSMEERAYFTTFMIGKGVSKATISGYLSALRHFELARGAVAPAENSELTKHLLTGLGNLKRDPKVDALKKQHRSILGKILQLLGHAIASSGKTEFEQSLLWSVSLCAFWGSFRKNLVLFVISKPLSQWDNPTKIGF